MPTVNEVIERLLPHGSRAGAEASWSACPTWPPDLFAVVATVAEVSGCYTAAAYSGRSGSGMFGPGYRRRVHAAARRWERDVFPPPPHVERLWRDLRAHGGLSTARGGPASRAWRDPVMELLAIADEACAGIGFTDENASAFATLVVKAHLEHLRTGGRVRVLPDVLATLCQRVPAAEACVQPKTRTAQVGCTLRSFSHNLALLPPSGNVECRWLLTGGRAAGPLRLLVVPYPYRIRPDAFVPGAAIRDAGSRSRHVRIEQTWLPPGGERAQARALASFLRGLLRAAAAERGPAHALVLPELALPERLARAVAVELTGERGLELFICGVASPPHGARGMARNRAYASLFFGAQQVEWRQSKHHRWRIDGSQAARYRLARLRGARFWWEEIDITRRKVNLSVFRPGASVAVLVCEDLARHEPVLPTLRAVGPNLVVALLLDGPQLMSRWPGQYASVLADDPGSSVLTVTSLGMVRLSMRAGRAGPMPVALWRQPWRKAGDEPRELALTQGGHALLIDVETFRERNWTHDGRSDHGATVGLELRGVHEIAHPDPPAWL